MTRPVATEREVRRPVAIRAPRFVGRERELAVLAQAVAADPSVILVEGEGGIGKTRLVREFLACLEGPDAGILVACCPPFCRPHTLGPVVDAVQQAVSDVRALGLSELAGALRAVLPEWARALPAPPEPLEDATAARHRVFRALAECLYQLGTRLLVIEDVHWADEATLEFLLFLASRQPRRVNLLVTCRPEDVPAGSLLLRLSRLAAGSAGLRLLLGPLDVAQTGSLVSSMLADEHVSEQFAVFLHDRTDGLPLAVEESVRLMGDRADLAFRHGSWARRHLADIEVPPTVRDAVLERTARLSPDALAVLRAAAVLGEPAAHSVVTAVTGLIGERARTGLLEALGCGLLTENLPNGQKLVFRHALAGRAVYEAIPVPARREMHLRAGRALEHTPVPPLARLTQHFREAGDTSQWCRYGEEAADLALAAGDHNTAAALLHGLITGADLPDRTVVRLFHKVHVALTGYAKIEDLANRLRLVLNGEALTPAEKAEAGFYLGRIFMDVGEVDQAAAELERALPGLAHRPAEAARAMLLLGQPAQATWPGARHRLWLDRAARPMMDSSISVSDRLELIAYRATGLLLLGEESGWATAAGIPEDTAAVEEICGTAIGCLNVGTGAVIWGHYDQARQRLTAAFRLAERHNYLRVRDGAPVTLAHLDWFTGDWAGLAERAETLARVDDVEPLIPLEAVLVAGLLDAATGANETAEKRLRQVLEEETRRGVAYLVVEPAAALSRLLLADGRIDEALALTEDAVKVITVKGIWIWATDVVPVRVRTLIAVGRVAEAGELVRAYAAGLRGCDAPAPQAALLACQGMLAAGLGEHLLAAGLFTQASKAWQTLPRPYDALLCREQQAHCELAAGRREAALALLCEVRNGLLTLGAHGDASRVVSVLRAHGVIRRGWRGGRPGYGDQLSPRELEVVRLVTAGRTNKEIGQALCRSPKTVDSQLKSAMRKLDVNSRTTLAVRAVELGIASGGKPTEDSVGLRP